MRFLFACLLVARASALQLRMSAAAPVKAAAAAPSAAAIKASYVLSSPRFRKGVKQVSTLGPASFDAAVIERLFLEGTDVFRLNLSHGASDKLEVAQCIRALEVKYDHPIGILADLQGPKHRVGMFSKDVPKVNLVKGQVYTFDLDSDTFGSESRVALPHPEVLQALEVGNAILLDDGKLRCVVTEKGDGFVVTEVMNDAALSSRKGFNLPDTVVPGEAMTPKDIADLEFLMEDFGGVTIDWIALSFVQRPEDMIELKTRINGRSKAMLLAKLEKPQAVEPDQLRAIVAACDGIMVARGDLGVEMAAEDVPIVQKEIIDECRAQGKPVIVATQMLESMIDSPSPTRAECSDVATAIFDGCDAVMLSGESAAGKYPIEAVAMQRRIIQRVESAPRYDLLMARVGVPEGAAISSDLADVDAIVAAASQLATAMRAKALVVFTTSGASARRMARLRPGVPAKMPRRNRGKALAPKVLAVTPNRDVARALTLSANVYPAVLDAALIAATPRSELFYRMLEQGISIARAKGLVEFDSDRLVCTAGLPFNVAGIANAIRVVEAGGLSSWEGHRLE